MKKSVFLVLVLLFSLSGCVANNESVVLEYFPAIDTEGNCKVSVDSNKYHDVGVFDVGIASNYTLIFQVANYMTDSSESGKGSKKASITTSNPNKWKINRFDLSFEFPPTSGLASSKWKDREIVNGGVVVDTNGKVAATLELFTGEQIADLLRVVKAKPNFDWASYPIIIKLKAKGVLLGDGKEMTTNTLQFAVIPEYGYMIQSGSVYYVPKDGFATKQDEYDAIKKQCEFNDPVKKGCGLFAGQDNNADLAVNCYYSSWATQTILDVANSSLDKGDGGSFACCPKKLPEAPKDDTKNGN